MRQPDQFVRAARHHPEFGSPVLAQVTGMLARWQEEVRPRAPGLSAGPSLVSPGSGHITLALGPPDEGPVVPAVALVYNSRTPTDGEAGWGWTVFPKSVVTSLTATAVDLAVGDGAVLRYNDKDSGGRYRPPGGAADALQYDATTGTWTRTATDGASVRYAPSGSDPNRAPAVWFRAPLGGRWTLGYDVGSRLTTLRDPLGGRTTLAYNAGGRLRRIAQPSGRLTTASFDASGHLTALTRPDGTRVSLTYDATHRLATVTDPLGATTQYQHTGGRLKGVTDAVGQRTTYTYFGDGNTAKTRVTDPVGQRTTLTFNRDGNLAVIVNPFGQRTSYAWANHRMVGYTTARGFRTSFGYAQKSDRTAVLTSVVDAGAAGTRSATTRTGSSRHSPTSSGSRRLWRGTPRGSGSGRRTLWVGS